MRSLQGPDTILPSGNSGTAIKHTQIRSRRNTVLSRPGNHPLRFPPWLLGRPEWEASPCRVGDAPGRRGPRGSSPAPQPTWALSLCPRRDLRSWRHPYPASGNTTSPREVWAAPCFQVPLGAELCPPRSIRWGPYSRDLAMPVFGDGVFTEVAQVSHDPQGTLSKVRLASLSEGSSGDTHTEG